MAVFASRRHHAVVVNKTTAGARTTIAVSGRYEVRARKPGQWISPQPPTGAAGTIPKLKLGNEVSPLSDGNGVEGVIPMGLLNCSTPWLMNVGDGIAIALTVIPN